MTYNSGFGDFIEIKTHGWIADFTGSGLAQVMLYYGSF